MFKDNTYRVRFAYEEQFLLYDQRRKMITSVIMKIVSGSSLSEVYYALNGKKL